MRESWRRHPEGAGMAAVQNRMHKSMGRMGAAVLHMEPDEYEEMLRDGGYSERMIGKEMTMFNAYKHQEKERQDAVKKRFNIFRQRDVNKGLSEYAKAEIRRSSGIVADDIIDSMEEENEPADKA